MTQTSFSHEALAASVLRWGRHVTEVRRKGALGDGTHAVELGVAVYNRSNTCCRSASGSEARADCGLRDSWELPRGGVRAWWVWWSGSVVLARLAWFASVS